MTLAPTLAHFVSLRRDESLPEAAALRPGQARAGGLGAAGLSPTGGNTCGPAKPVPRCFWNGADCGRTA